MEKNIVMPNIIHNKGTFTKKQIEHIQREMLKYRHDRRSWKGNFTWRDMAWLLLGWIIGTTWMLVWLLAIWVV